MCNSLVHLPLPIVGFIEKNGSNLTRSESEFLMLVHYKFVRFCKSRIRIPARKD
jgi:hypothetical protein